MCVHVADPPGRLGPTGNFMALLHSVPHVDAVAFADQDNVWLPHKLALGQAALVLPSGADALLQPAVAG